MNMRERALSKIVDEIITIIQLKGVVKSEEFKTLDNYHQELIQFELKKHQQILKELN